MRIRALITVAAALSLAGCRTETASAPAASQPASTVTVTAPAASAAPKVSTAPTPTQPHAELVKIPAVVGKNHQLAQDTMQAAGLYNLREKDATGQGRLLIWDRNWVVVRQTPSAGRRVSPNTVITLYSKKIGE